MKSIPSYHSIPNGKLIVFTKDEFDFQNVQSFLKALGIKRDYRKNFLKGEFYEDQWCCTSTKNDEVVISAFITQNKVLLQIIYQKEEFKSKTFNLTGEYFS